MSTFFNCTLSTPEWKHVNALKSWAKNYSTVTPLVSQKIKWHKTTILKTITFMFVISKPSPMHINWDRCVLPFLQIWPRFVVKLCSKNSLDWSKIVIIKIYINIRSYPTSHLPYNMNNQIKNEVISMNSLIYPPTYSMQAYFGSASAAKAKLSKMHFLSW
jgi:hypothetical protein